MFAGLSVDATTVHSLDEDSTITLAFDTDTDTEFRCATCGTNLVETSGGFVDDNGDRDCPDHFPDDPDTDSTGPHTPERVALSWCNSASIRTDESDDAITLSLSTGDPRGAFTFIIRRVPDDADSPLAGRLLLHMPYPGEPMAHEPLHAVHPGTFVIGRPAPLTRAHLTSA